MSKNADNARDDLLMAIGRGLGLLMSELSVEAGEARGDFEDLAWQLASRSDLLSAHLESGGYR